nr:hypothetical protein [Tanacetum cinerariifolium]
MLLSFDVQAHTIWGMSCPCGPYEWERYHFEVKENPKNDKIGSKPDKNGKRGEAKKSQKQLQCIEEEILKKMQKEGPEMQTHASFKERKKIEGLEVQFP